MWSGAAGAGRSGAVTHVYDDEFNVIATITLTKYIFV